MRAQLGHYLVSHGYGTSLAMKDQLVA